MPLETQRVDAPQPGDRRRRDADDRGIVRCEILAADTPELLSFSWRNQETDPPSTVTCQLDETATGTRLTYRHTGFRGAGGFFMARLLHRVRRRMLTEGLPGVLAAGDW
ncbi:SRPBCC domain-containing protein [Amycolatopsis mongoliensis]|uniref:SRPBCC domain-containing protein n=1 Tax=Amycolatopsis mongoliensis TaxID=715475 RepID=A0A9Y2JLF5_9PSEU|nr:SRPBCC domain-containing protein [Amycolatopsis sp. 4-36]WIY00643.1 SRPBCC domain-containing protein [Amycolatopsis sp. 4-36]